MAMPINVASYFLPREGSTYFLLEDKYVKGGFSSVANISERDNIFELNLKIGAHVYVVETKQTFRLDGVEPATWVETSLSKKVPQLLPYDITFGAFSTVTAGAVLGGVVLNRSVLITAEGAHRAVCESAPANDVAVFNVLKNAVPIGTISFAKGATLGVFSLTDTALVDGDRFQVVAQPVFDGTIDQIMITITGSCQVGG